MIKTLNVQKDYQEIFSLSQFAFQYKLSEAELDKKREEAWRHTIWGHMDGDKIAAKLHLIPLSIYIGGKEFDMGGISSVATWPEYRRKGMVKDLLKHALQYMRENGQSVSYLHPFSVPFYRHFGWELAFNEKSYAIPIEKLKKKWGGTGLVRRISQDINLLHSLYQDYAKSFTGTLVRDEKWWEQRVLNENMHIAVAYDEQGTPEGYILFEVKDKIFNVIELVACSINAKKLLLEFIANHDSMVEKVNMTVPENDALPLLIDEPRFEQKIEPYFMARIVDVSQFLKAYPFNHIGTVQEAVTLHVMDEFLPENTGIYHIQYSRKGMELSKSTIQNDSKKMIKCTIQQLTSMLFGYTRPLQLLDHLLIEGDRSEVNKLEELIPIQQPYFGDYF